MFLASAFKMQGRQDTRDAARILAAQIDEEQGAGRRDPTIVKKGRLGGPCHMGVSVTVGSSRR